jgi:hypothetical protein
MRTRDRATLASLAVVVLSATAACTSVPAPADPSIADVTYLGLPAEGGDLRPQVDPETPGIGYARGAEPRTVNVVTVGSSACPLTPVDYTWDEEERSITFRFGRREGTDHYPCTLDVAPSTSVVLVPQLPLDEPVTVVTKGGDVVLPVAR